MIVDADVALQQILKINQYYLEEKTTDNICNLMRTRYKYK